MIPTLALPNIQLSPPPMTESFAGVPTQTSALARLPFYAVPSNSNSGTVYNNSRYTGYAPQLVAQNAGSPVLPPLVRNHTPAGVQSAQPGVFSSSFMAQIFGQGGLAQSSDLFNSFFTASRPPALTLDPEIIERFSLTKYKPSDASRPQPALQGGAAIVFPVAENRIEQQRLIAQQIQQPVPEQAVTTPVAAVNAATKAAYASTNTASVLAENTPRNQATQNAPQRSNNIRFGNSLIRPRGVEAYVATFSRNVVNLGGKENDEPVRASL
jgi:hypothetical protein